MKIWKTKGSELYANDFTVLEQENNACEKWVFNVDNVFFLPYFSRNSYRFPAQDGVVPLTDLALLLLLLGGLLLAGGRLGGLGRLWLWDGGLCWGQGLLLDLLLVGGQGGSAAGDVDVLPVIGHVLQGELRTVAGGQTHGARGQSVGRLAHLCRPKRVSVRGFSEDFCITILVQWQCQCCKVH